MDEVELLPGVEAFIKQANDLGLPMAVASSSSAEWVIGHLERFRLRHYFKSVVTSEDVQHVKPEPDLYLLALQNLGLSNVSVLAFEDSPNGIKAAKAAGLHCLAVPNLITREMDLQQADKMYGSFLELHPDLDFEI
jgi:HAD superfamily hydrolase (TIGR01509 family)